ncbi:MAG: homoserine dehydrogenase, partial [Anaerolineae bacterium]
VMANKKALAGPWSTAQNYFNHPRVRHESTVGGGQPVIATLRALLDTHDTIHQIEGQLSGTLGYICSQLDQGVPFSRAVAEAKANGFTEPDPREDLGGQDVMRKVMILGRMAGWPLEASDITVESLYPAEMANLSVPKFMKAVAELDVAIEKRVAAAAAEGKVLRYVAELEEGCGKVGLKTVPAASPLANLKYISFHTGRYHDEPLLIGGKGAGVEMTAAGVLGDMIDLVREM